MGGTLGGYVLHFLHDCHWTYVRDLVEWYASTWTLFYPEMLPEQKTEENSNCHCRIKQMFWFIFQHITSFSLNLCLVTIDFWNQEDHSELYCIILYCVCARIFAMHHSYIQPLIYSCTPKYCNYIDLLVSPVLLHISFYKLFTAFLWIPFI